jgi:hypothetical protein
MNPKAGSCPLTHAVCFNCGNMKFGALIPCRNCRAAPSSRREIDLSQALTNHFFEATELERFSLEIKRGVRLRLVDENGKPVGEQDPNPRS